MLTIKHNRATLVHIFLAILAIVGFSFGDQYLNHWYEKLIAVIVLCLIIGSIIFGRDKRVYVFKQNSPKLGVFFQQWYTRPGELSVYCTDLEWIKWKPVLNALLDKARENKLSLYLRKIEKNSTDLELLGAKVYIIQYSSSTQHRFSIIKNDGFERIICRNKVIESADSKSEIIEFISTCSSRDPYLIALAKDVLSYCTRMP